MKILTKKQKQVYDYITAHVEQRGFAPSLQEIADNFNFLNYTSSARHYIQKLQEKGYLKRTPNSPRAIDINKDANANMSFLINDAPSFVQVPILGTANAGEAIACAKEDVEGYLRVAKKITDDKNNLFALRISGDSMDKARISRKNVADGDFVLVDSEYRIPENGDYVLSIINGCANIKKFKRDRDGNICLMSESTNTEHKPIYISSEDNFMINGKIVGVIKK